LKALRSSFWLHSIFYTLLQRFSLFFFGAVSYILLTRAFGTDKESMAVWALYLAILNIFEMVKQGLLRNSTIKYFSSPAYANKKDEVQSSSLALNIAFSLLIVILFLGFAPLISSLLKSPALQPLLWWSVMFVLVLIPFNHCEILLLANYRFNGIFWAYFIRQAIYFGGIVLLFFFLREYFTLMNLLILQVLSLFVGSVIMFYASQSLLMKKFHYDVKIIRDIFNFGRYTFGTNLFSNVARSLDHFVTANVLSPAEGKHYVAFYNVVGRVNNMIDVPSLAIADVLYPKNVETLEKDGMGKVKYHFERMTGTILAIIIPASLLIFVFPQIIVYVLAGKQYTGAIYILQLTILFSIVRPVGYLFGSTLDAIGKPKVNFWTTGGYMVFTLLVNYICLSQFGGIGAAYATMIVYTLSSWVMIVILKRYVGIEVSKIGKYTIQTYSDIIKLPRTILAARNASAKIPVEGALESTDR